MNQGLNLLPLAILLCVGCNNNNEREIEKVNQVIYTLIEADNHSDLKTVLNSYTDSIEFYPAGRPFTKGIENVQKSYEQLFKENRLRISTRILETKVFGDDAMITGVNTGTKTSLLDSTVVNLNDKYIAILERNQKGEWKIDKLIWSSNK